MTKKGLVRCVGRGLFALIPGRSGNAPLINQAASIVARLLQSATAPIIASPAEQKQNYEDQKDKGKSVHDAFLSWLSFRPGLALKHVRSHFVRQSAFTTFGLIVPIVCSWGSRCRSCCPLHSWHVSCRPPGNLHSCFFRFSFSFSVVLPCRSADLDSVSCIDRAVCGFGPVTAWTAPQAHITPGR